MTKTKQNARNLLKNTDGCKRIAGTPQFNITSPIIKKCLFSTQIHIDLNSILLEKLMRKKKLKIDNALARLSLINRQLLYYTYCSIEKKTNVWIASELGYSVSNVETLKVCHFLNLLKHMNLVCFNAIKVRLTEIVVFAVLWRIKS